jgi:hypothetical protein
VFRHLVPGETGSRAATASRMRRWASIPFSMLPGRAHTLDGSDPRISQGRSSSASV